MAPEGVPIVIGFVLVGCLLTALSFWFAPVVVGWAVGVVALVLCVWCVWFFRDPRRNIPSDSNVAIAPADGVVVQIGAALPPEELGVPEAIASKMVRVCIFMNVFNVHVNRAPERCEIVKIAYRPGKFLNASLDKASIDNERSSMRVRLEDGREMVVVQIAGLVARRIVSRVKEGERLDRAERYGLIRFGSRVDVYLPEGSEPRVRLGQKTVAGETIIATLASSAR